MKMKSLTPLTSPTGGNAHRPRDTSTWSPSPSEIHHDRTLPCDWSAGNVAPPSPVGRARVVGTPHSADQQAAHENGVYAGFRAPHGPQGDRADDDDVAPSVLPSGDSLLPLVRLTSGHPTDMGSFAPVPLAIKVGRGHPSPSWGGTPVDITVSLQFVDPAGTHLSPDGHRPARRADDNVARSGRIHCSAPYTRPAPYLERASFPSSHPIRLAPSSVSNLGSHSFLVPVEDMDVSVQQVGPAIVELIQEIRNTLCAPCLLRRASCDHTTAACSQSPWKQSAHKYRAFKNACRREGHCFACLLPMVRPHVSLVRMMH